jgi:hypothetical protein
VNGETECEAKSEDMLIPEAFWGAKGLAPSNVSLKMVLVVILEEDFDLLG